MATTVLSIAASGEEVLLKTVDVPSANATASDQLSFQYDIEKTVAWLKERDFQRVALQFPDELLVDSVSVSSLIEAEMGVKPFILADTAYGSCCVDEIAAAHGNADCLVHYGAACLSSASRIPVYYVFSKSVLDLSTLELKLSGAVEHLRNTFLPHRRKLVVVADFAFYYVKDSLKEVLNRIWSGCGFTVVFASPRLSFTSHTDSDAVDDVLGYQAECFQEEQFSTEGIFLMIGSEGPLLTNFMMAFPTCPFVTYNPQTTTVRIESADVNKMLRKRLFLVEKLKDASCIGVVVGTLVASGYLEVTRRTELLLKTAGKKFFTFCVGQVNVAKLANFPEIDVFILVSCIFNRLIFDWAEFYRPIVTPFEAEVAFGSRQCWFADTAWMLTSAAASETSGIFQLLIGLRQTAPACRLSASLQDLITQGEKLRKTDQRLDEISATTKETQKHLTGIKSIFGGMKNYFRGDPKAKNPSAADTSAAGQTPTGGKLDATVNQLKSADSYGEEKKIMKKSDTSGSVKGDAKIPSLQGTQWQDVDTEIDQNLDLMGAHLARIRSLGLALGEEVDTQNQLIDNITVKAQKADAVIRDQDKQMLKIMGGGKKK